MITRENFGKLKTLGCVVAAILFAGMLPANAHADEMPQEIDYLLTTVGSSECTFIRNGSRYAAADAEAHLRMKYKRGKRYASTTEKFIDRLASKSSFSKKPYYIECSDQEKVVSSEWLKARLEEYRVSSTGPQSDF